MKLSIIANCLRNTTLITVLMLFGIIVFVGCGGGGGGGGGGGDTSILDLGTPGDYSGDSTLTKKSTTFEISDTEIVTVDDENNQVIIENPARAYLVGDVILGDENLRFAKRIIAVSDVGGRIILDVEPVTMEDVFDEGSFSFDITPDWSQGQVDPSAVLQKPFAQYFIDNSVPRALDSGAISSNGSINLDNTSLFDIIVDYNSEQELYQIDWDNSSIMGETIDDNGSGDQGDIQDSVSRSEFHSAGQIKATIIEGQLSVVPTIRADYDLTPTGLDTANCTMDMLMVLNAVIEVEASGIINFEFSRNLLPKISVPVIIPGAPPMDVQLSIPASFLLDARLNGTATFEYRRQHEIVVDMSYDRSRSESFQSTIEKIDLPVERTVLISAIGSIEAQLTLKPRVTVKVFKIAGPFIEVRPYIRGLLAIEYNGQRYDWVDNQSDLYIGINGGVGLALDWYLDSAEWQTPDLLDFDPYEWDIVQPGDYDGPQDNPDSDNDGVPDIEDMCPDTPNGEQVDENGCSQAPSNGLVAHYPFNGNANDDSGNAFNGSVVDAILTSDGYDNPDSAYQFNGLTGYINTIPRAQIPSQITVSMWIKPEVSQGKQLWGSGEQTGGSKDGYIAHVTPEGGLNFYIWKGNSRNHGLVETADGIVPINEWSHVAFTLDASGHAAIYLNGILRADGVFSTIPDVHDHSHLMIGRGFIGDLGGGGSRFEWTFDGSIDEVSIYGRSLSEQEIFTLFRSY